MAVTFGAGLSAVVLAGAGCGGTLEGRYRRGEIGPGGTTTTRPAGNPRPAGAARAAGIDHAGGPGVRAQEPTP